MPGFSALPEIKTLTSLISDRLIYASVPIKAAITLDFINFEASFKDRPAIVIFPISGRLIAPSRLMKKSSM